MQLPKIVEKPWGYEEWWAHTGKYVAKLLYIRKGNRLSLQYHNVKDETIRVLTGQLKLTFGDEERVMHSGDIVHVPPGTVHRMAADVEDVYVLEASTPEVDDVVRLSDDYKRQ